MSHLLPLFPLDLVLFPETLLPLHIFEPRYREMIGECLRQKQEFGIVRVLPQEQQKESPGNHLADIGCTAEIVDVLRRFPDGRMDILIRGGRRFSLVALDEKRSFLRGEVLLFDDDPSHIPEKQLRKEMVAMHHQFMLLTSSESVNVDAESPLLSFQLGGALPVDLEFKQQLLDMRSERQRLKVLQDYYSKVIPKLKTMMLRRKQAGTNGFVH